MELLEAYFNEIKDRQTQDLSAKPIENGELVKELIREIKSSNSIYRKPALNLLIYNVLPGTTSAAHQKAEFLQDLIYRKYLFCFLIYNLVFQYYF